MKLENYTIDKRISKIQFACDLVKCKGACCTFYGVEGAPLNESELEDIAVNLDAIKEYLSQSSIDYIDKYGYAQRAITGDLTTQCINNQDCVFVYYEGDIAKCAIEKAYFDGKSSFRKPISCHLFPIRVRDGKIYYEEIPQCQPGKDKGKNDSIPILDYLQEPLERRFGEEFYNKLKSNGT